MKICLKCGRHHNGKGLHCSRSCANSRRWTEEDKLKKKIANKEYWNSLTEIEKEEIKQKIIRAKDRTIISWIKKANTNFESLGNGAKKKVLVYERGYHCQVCNISSWQGIPICLELDHIDGNKLNNHKCNLRLLCPNCHSQTPTWRGKKNGISKRQNGIIVVANIKRA